MFSNLANTVSNCFKIPELKSRLIFTALVLAIARVAALVHIPGLDGAQLAKFFSEHAGDSNSMMGMLSLFTGGALEHCAIGSLSIMPYISATIIIQLLTAVVPRLSKLAREEGGRSKIIQYGRYLTVLICIGQGTALTLSWENPGAVFNGFQGTLVLWKSIWMYRIVTVIILTAGTMLLMWLGEQITERGIGNGISLIISIGIVARLPLAFVSLRDMLLSGGAGGGASGQYGKILFLLVLLAVVIGAIIAVTQAQRKIPVQYAQRAVGRKVFAGGTSFMPLKVNYAGVMPVIFAQAILSFPQMMFTSLSRLPNMPDWVRSISNTLSILLQNYSLTYVILYSLMILFFSYFWVATQFNELQIADDLKKNGGYIPGVRPGQATSDYLHHAMTRITLAGAIFLMIIAVVPTLLYTWMKVDPNLGNFFGGTSILIIVGVLLDTMRQIESHLLMRHYDGFLKKGRIKGRF
jgi:preprotein translocase subunit SecY